MRRKALFQPGAQTDLPALCRDTLRQRIAEIESGRARLLIPKLRDHMQNMPGAHFHLTPEIFLQLSGGTTFRFPREVFRLYPHGICIMPRGIPHAETMWPWRGPFYNLVFMFRGKTLYYHLAQARQKSQPGIRIASSLEAPLVQRLPDYLTDCTDAFHKKTPEAGLAVKGLLLACFSSLIMLLEEEHAPDKDEHFRIVQARQFVMSHLNNCNLSVAQLAEWVRCTPDYLSWIFHRQTGATLIQYINEQRLSQAKHLLDTTALNVKEIAVAIGFADAGYFARLFRRATGVTPREYRKRKTGVGPAPP
jgi:AraC-like DNA-binding protein